MRTSTIIGMAHFGIILEHPIPANKCYLWLENYLGNNPTEKDYQNLLSAISALVYSDEYIDTEEAKLLTQIQNLDPNKSSPQSTFEQVLKAIQKFIDGVLINSKLPYPCGLK